jgi:lipoate-protein ligase A
VTEREFELLYYNSPGYDPRYNLALEEYLMKDYASGEDVVMLWQGRPSVLIGRHQNTLEEVDPEYIRENGLLVVRRVTGGGAVYQDMGNVNFSYIIRQGSGSLYDFRRFTAPVIEALAAMGAHAEFNSRNDITIDGKKISGNAQYIYKNTVLHHGTLLFALKGPACAAR